MSIITEIFPLCDICGLTNPDIKEYSKKRVKLVMRSEGWKKVKGKDVCPACLEDGKLRKE